MIDYILALILSINTDYVFFYLLIGLIDLLILIRHYVHKNGYVDIENNMSSLIMFGFFLWPYIVFHLILSWFQWLFSLPLFTWAFWLQPIKLPTFRKPF